MDPQNWLKLLNIRPLVPHSIKGANFVSNFVAMATGVNRGKYKCHR